MHNRQAQSSETASLGTVSAPRVSLPHNRPIGARKPHRMEQTPRSAWRLLIEPVQGNRGAPENPALELERLRGMRRVAEGVYWIVVLQSI
eukprot:2188707-Pyramimonas_sp.AAC.2